MVPLKSPTTFVLYLRCTALHSFSLQQRPLSLPFRRPVGSDRSIQTQLTPPTTSAAIALHPTPLPRHHPPSLTCPAPSTSAAPIPLPPHHSLLAATTPSIYITASLGLQNAVAALTRILQHRNIRLEPWSKQRATPRRGSLHSTSAQFMCLMRCIVGLVLAYNFNNWSSLCMC
jgi:hypothetical protein